MSDVVVTVFIVGRSGMRAVSGHGGFTAASARVSERTCLDAAAQFASVVRAGMSIEVHLYDPRDRPREYEWSGVATGEITRATLERDLAEDRLVP